MNHSRTSIKIIHTMTNTTVKFKIPYFETFLHYTGVVVSKWGNYTKVSCAQLGITDIHNDCIYE